MSRSKSSVCSVLSALLYCVRSGECKFCHSVSTVRDMFITLTDMALTAHKLYLVCPF